MNQCFVFFCRQLDRKNTAILSKLADGIKQHVDIYVLSYIEQGHLNLVETPNDFIKAHITITRSTLEEQFANFPNKYRSSNWAIMPGNLDLVHIAFANIFSQYQHYWFCEDDVRYSGNIKTLIDYFANYDQVDLLATSYRKHNPNFAHQHSLKIPENHGQNYQMRTFLPFFRVSKTAIETLINAYISGWAGHHEIAWPNILLSAKKTIKDINDFERVFYSDHTSEKVTRYGSFVYQPPKLLAGKKADYLWHPIKPPKAYFKRKVRTMLTKILNS